MNYDPKKLVDDYLLRHGVEFVPYNSNKLVDDYLMHHGIQGQRWGVKHGPPYPLDRETSQRVTKGEKVGSTEGDYNSRDFKYRTDTRDKVFNNVRVNLLAMVPILGPIYAIYHNTKIISRNLDHRDYTKDQGEPEELSKLKKKDHPTTSEEDIKLINPRQFGDSNGTFNNCTNCTMALEMRARGYDVAARKKAQGRYNNEWSEYFSGVDRSSWTQIRKPTKGFNKATTTQFYNEIVDNIEKQKKGSRGALNLTWKQGGAHSIFYTVTDGGVKFYDGQTGKMGRDLDVYFALANSAMYVRLDNKKVTSKITDAVISRG